MSTTQLPQSLAWEAPPPGGLICHLLSRRVWNENCASRPLARAGDTAIRSQRSGAKDRRLGFLHLFTVAKA